MCGLVGILDRRAAPGELEPILRSMAATLTHRGPDGEGYLVRGACGFGFRRLAITDVDAPSPPYSNESRSVWSVANAEIYNCAELRAELVDRGHLFTTRVDTEVISHLWEEEAADLVPRLNGMFALAVWDERRETLLLARDRAGEKPLFYWQDDHGTVVFASELGALLEHPRIPRAVDVVALRRYLLHDYFPAPSTPFAGIRKLPAGHRLLAKPEGISVDAYWDLAASFDNPALARRRPEDLAEELDARIGLAVARRRIADVPLGIFLSGGLDSSTILAHLAEQLGTGVPAFVLGHTDPEFDESRWASETCRCFGAECHRLVLDEADLAEGLRRIGQGFDEPLGDASTIPSHLLALHARRHVKVVLSGEGADELFAGYPTYLGHRVAGWYRRLPAPLRRAVLAAARRAPVTMGNVNLAYLLGRFAAAAEHGTIERHHLWFGSFGPEAGAAVLAPAISELLREDDFFAAAKARLAGRHFPDELSSLLYCDFTMYLQDDLLTKIDRATMLASLEARAPFLDHELAEFAAGIPSRMKLRGHRLKAILRRASRGRLPGAVLARRKRGFNIPFSRWLLHGLGEELRARFAPDRVAARGLLSAAGVGRLLSEHLASKADHRKPLFNLLALDLWCDRIYGEGVRVPIASPAGAPAELERVRS